MKPIGGYFSLEINYGEEFHKNALRLNAGRYALEYILRSRQYKKVYLPYYICDSVLQPFKRLGIAYEFYHINEQLEPAVILKPAADEAVLYVNYFGLKNLYAETFCNTYCNTILDQTQAFYNVRCKKHEDKNLQYDTFYSCRKFFGVPDGAYLYTNCFIDEELLQDKSYERMAFLTKRIDLSAQEGYADFHSNDGQLSLVGMRRMSRLTEAMMHGIDYTSKANRRIRNFHVLNKSLQNSNFFKWDKDIETVPLIYPYYIENGAELRQYLINHQVFCACYWPNVLKWCQPEDIEFQLTKNLVCLPIDQRYDERNMNQILEYIKNFHD